MGLVRNPTAPISRLCPSSKALKLGGMDTIPPKLNLTDFLGLWHIDRVTTDYLGGADGVFVAQAEILIHEPGAIYTETGELTLANAAPMRATRQYLWQQTGGLITVDFADGRPFHTFDPMAAAPSAEHDCPPDTYCVEYDFADWPRWQSRWRVRGPRKDYLMVSNFRR